MKTILVNKSRLVNPTGALSRNMSNQKITFDLTSRIGSAIKENEEGDTSRHTKFPNFKTLHHLNQSSELGDNKGTTMALQGDFDQLPKPAPFELRSRSQFVSTQFGEGRPGH